MTEGIYLEIENKRALATFVKGAVRNGYLRRFDLRDVADWINETAYPIRVPVNLESVIGVGANPVVKGIFGGNIDKVLSNCIQEAIDAKKGERGGQ